MITGWNDEHVLERLCAPLQEREPLLVPLELESLILGQGVGGPGEVNLNGVVDDKIRRTLGVDQLGVSAQLLDGVPHGCEVDHGRDAREVLEDDSGRPKGNLDPRRVGLVLLPRKDFVNIRLENL